MAKFHIDKDGLPKVCRAKTKPCPLGGDESHFDTIEKAQQYIDELHSKKYGMFGEKVDDTKNFKEMMADKNSLASRVLEQSSVQNIGFDFECYAASVHAEKLGLDKVIINNGDSVKSDFDGQVQDEILSQVTDKLKSYYDEHGASIKDTTGLCRVIYTNDDQDKFVVQTGSPNVLDAAIITSDNIDIVEIKKGHGGGAQFGQLTFPVNEDGKIAGYDTLPSEIRSTLENYNVEMSMGTNYKLPVSSDSALEYFIDEYRSKGATSAIFTDSNEKAIYIDLNKPNDKVIEDMKVHNISAFLNVRANKNTKKLDKSAEARFNKKMTHLLKDGVKFNGSNFKISDVKEEHLKSWGRYVRIDEFCLPINSPDDDRTINLEEVKFFPPMLAGTIKANR